MAPAAVADIIASQFLLGAGHRHHFRMEQRAVRNDDKVDPRSDQPAITVKDSGPEGSPGFVPHVPAGKLQHKTHSVVYFRKYPG